MFNLNKLLSISALCALLLTFPSIIASSSTINNQSLDSQQIAAGHHSSHQKSGSHHGHSRQSKHAKSHTKHSAKQHKNHVQHKQGLKHSNKSMHQNQDLHHGTHRFPKTERIQGYDYHPDDTLTQYLIPNNPQYMPPGVFADVGNMPPETPPSDSSTPPVPTEPPTTITIVQEPPPQSEEPVKPIKPTGKMTWSQRSEAMDAAAKKCFELVNIPTTEEEDEKGEDPIWQQFEMMIFIQCMHEEMLKLNTIRPPA